MDDTVAALLDRLKTRRNRWNGHTLRAEFAADPDRFDRFSVAFDDILFDYSKTHVDAETLALLVELAEAADLIGWRERKLSGDAINTTERRAVLHTALRDRSRRAIHLGDQDVAADVASVLAHMEDFTDAVRSGGIRGATGEAFTDVVNIGIGGSDLGPRMAARALSPYRDGGPRVHYVANVDGADLADTLATLDPARTLFLIASKTFTTLETMTNAASARAWIAGQLGEAAVPDHFAALSTALDKVAAFGVRADRTFGFWDWVGGRYSTWSAIGLSLALSIGFRNFSAFLDGAADMDEHFQTAPLDRNIPVLMGMIGAWYRDAWDYRTLAVLPYDQRLEHFPAFLQQLDMESNGKRVTRDGVPVSVPTGPIVFGEPGTNGQHAFYQLLHQGTDVVPCEFLVACQPHETLEGDHHAKLVANCLAQAEALMRGRTEEEARAQMLASGMSATEADRLAPHRTFPGDRPSTMLMYRKLDPRTLGRLVALYEHKVFVQGVIWNINSFDQYGVELGKELASVLLGAVAGGEPLTASDGSTAGLVARYRAMRGEA
ncbi:glucose-6-phosphate isomerase [Amorphus orientalis]|uniref:Glucose-6-phosphate isomerase n=1 Tax=Amorphus orientalis TaxID=649198 RepID=A0AAE3VSH8_9HYPH|nr:glucose-6-phosphate isomerase [Amorphus orientalis]MDQ0317148.1 glucose-6-phosphate isomerase [Amorphus orientalis]